MTGDANASSDHKRGQVRDMGEGELEPVHRRMEGKGREAAHARSGPPHQPRAGRDWQGTFSNLEPRSNKLIASAGRIMKEDGVPALPARAK